MCLDLNANVLSTMPPYLVDAAESLDDGWLDNPDPDIYPDWEEFAKQLFWDYQLGEAFVLATARYSTGWPARFHVLPPWAVEIEVDNGRRTYTVGRVDVTADLLHIRYQGSVDDAHGHGPLEAGGARQTAAAVLLQYASQLAAGGGIPPSVLEHPDELSADQAMELQAQWVQARMSRIGEPAVLSGGVTWKPTQVNPRDMALVDLMQGAESRIAVLLGVPPQLVGLPSGGDPLTYRTMTGLLDFHWRAYLRPKAQSVMSALSGWLLPRGTRVELNRDEYVRPELLERAQTWKIFLEAGVMTIDEVREVERVDDIVSAPAAQ
jgi:HK97 family phage portal protein